MGGIQYTRGQFRIPNRDEANVKRIQSFPRSHSNTRKDKDGYLREKWNHQSSVMHRFFYVNFRRNTLRVKMNKQKVAANQLRFEEQVSLGL